MNTHQLTSLPQWNNLLKKLLANHHESDKNVKI
jgi:hypothetical protein